MGKALLWCLFVSLFGALVVSMSIASFTYARYLDSVQVRNYLGYRLAESGAEPAGRLAVQTGAAWS